MISKKSILLLSLIASTLPTSLFAESISLGGSQSTLLLETFNTITTTEYSYEPYETTCYEQVVVGSRRECRRTSRPIYENKCEKVPGVGPVCKKEQTGSTSEEVCRDVPITESHAYTCTRSRKVAYQVPDYDIKTAITVVKSESARDFDLRGCALSVSVIANSESFTANCKTAIVKARVSDRKEVIVNRNKSRTMKVTLDFSSIEPLKAFTEGITSLSYEDNTLSFVSSNLDQASNFTLGLSISRDRLLLKDKVIFSKNLKASDFTVEAMGDSKAKISIHLAQIGASFDETKKHVLKVTLQATKKVDLQNVINSPALKNELAESVTVNN